MTQSVWEINPNNSIVIEDENETQSYKLFSHCTNDEFITYQIIIPFNSTRSITSFPPYNNGFIAISKDNHFQHIFPEIEHHNHPEHYSYPTSFQRVEIWQVISPDKEKSFRSFYEYMAKDFEGNLVKKISGPQNPSASTRYEIGVRFFKESDIFSLDTNCKTITSSPGGYDVVFKNATLKYDKYKNPKSFRIIATPFAFILDVVTSPIQFLVAFCSGEWIPT